MTTTDRMFLEVFRHIDKELESIRKILQAEKAPAQITISKDGMIVKGNNVMPDLETFFESKEGK